MTKHIVLPDFLTDEEIILAQRMYKDNRNSFRKEFKAKVLDPNMPRINAALKQENDAGYLSYVVEYVMGQLYG